LRRKLNAGHVLTPHKVMRDLAGGVQTKVTVTESLGAPLGVDGRTRPQNSTIQRFNISKVIEIVAEL
jgi:hypothetical protein